MEDYFQVANLEDRPWVRIFIPKIQRPDLSNWKPSYYCKQCGNKMKRRPGFCSKSCRWAANIEMHRVEQRKYYASKHPETYVSHGDPRRAELRKKKITELENSRLEKQELAAKRSVLKLNSKLRIFRAKECHCGLVFETLYKNQKYCRQCRYARANETGDVKSRCLKYGHRYDSKVTLKTIRTRDQEICKLCNSRIIQEGKWAERATMDHIIPLSNPSSPGHILENVQLAHRGCNSKKGIK